MCNIFTYYMYYIPPFRLYKDRTQHHLLFHGLLHSFSAVPVVKIHGSRRVDITEGHTISLTCTARSNVQIRSIDWLKGDIFLSRDNEFQVRTNTNLTHSFSELTILHVRRHYTGFLICRAENKAGVSEDKVFINLKCKLFLTCILLFILLSVFSPSYI